MMRLLKAMCLGILLSALPLLGTRAAPADAPPEQVSKADLVTQVQGHLKAERYEEAVAALEALYQLEKKPVVLLNIAVAREKQRASCQLRSGAYERVLRHCKGCQEELQARKRLAFIKGDCFGTLELDSNPPGLELTVDKRSIGRAPKTVELAEGTYEIGVQDGKAIRTQVVTVTRKATEQVMLKGPPPPPASPVTPAISQATSPSSSTSVLLPLSVTGGGLVLAGVGTYFMIAARAVHDEVDNLDHNVTKADYQTDAVERQELGATLLGIGSAVVVGGLTWWALSGADDAGAAPETAAGSISVSLAPGMLFVGGPL